MILAENTPCFEKIAQEFEKNKKKLLAIGMKLLGCYKYKEEIAGEDLAKELLFDILSRILTGDLKWSEEKYPDFGFFFYLKLKCEILTRLKSKTNRQRNVTISIHTTDETDTEDPNFSFIHNIADDQISPLDKVIFQESEKIIKEKLAPDEEATIVYEFALSGYQNHEISEVMEKPIENVTNAKKRMKRVVNKVIPSMHKSINKKELQCRTTELKI